jgi:hypothetical protein
MTAIGGNQVIRFIFKRMVFTNVELIGLRIILVVAVLVPAALSFRLIFSYVVTDNEIEVLLFHAMSIYRVPFEQIDSLHEALSMESRSSLRGFSFLCRQGAESVRVSQGDKDAKLL